MEPPSHGITIRYRPIALLIGFAPAAAGPDTRSGPTSPVPNKVM